jgi:prepilin-type N-terminal cleavage/methylation domain-containing protein
MMHKVPFAGKWSCVKLLQIAGRRPSARNAAFTLIELLVVITIIVILMGLLFPAFKGVQDQAKRAQAKNDLTQIVTAINAFYTEYGQYPCGAQTPPGSEAQDWFSQSAQDKKDIFNDLRVPFGPTTRNARGIVFLQPTVAKDLANPKAGVGNDGIFYDPWGSSYLIRMDNNYNNLIPNPYTKNAGFSPNMNAGVIAWSIGKDQKSDAMPGPASDKKTGTNDDDVISWQ